MAASGAPALATTSAGFAFTLGRPDGGTVSRDEALRHAAEMVAATPLPVSGDFENGFADAPEDVAETVRLAREAGLSGCSIEDTVMSDVKASYEFDDAVERVAAAADAARSLEDPFVLCARADGVMHGVYDMDEAVLRIRAFESAGADLLYVPVVPSVETLELVVHAVSKPVNALAAGALSRVTVSELASIGVRRISVGSMIARMTHSGILRAMASINSGDFASFSEAASGVEIDHLLAEGSTS